MTSCDFKFITPFHLDGLNKIFLICGEHLNDVADEIDHSISYFDYVRQIRNNVPDIEVARERMERTMTAAIELHNILAEDFVTNSLFRSFTYNMFSLKDNPQIPGEKYTKREITLKFLREIYDNSRSLLCDDDLLRTYYMMPDRRKANQNLISYALWPRLFEIYYSKFGKIGKSIDGPFKRYIALVHDAAGLPEVVGPTLKRAVAEWLQDKARSPEGGALTGQSSP